MKKRIVSIIALLCLFATTLVSIAITASATYAFPSLSSTKYCEFKAAANIPVYSDSACSTRGTSSPAQSYNAEVYNDDTCQIIKITSSYIELKYPTTSGLKTGYIKRNALISVSEPTDMLSSSKASVDVFDKVGGSSSYGKTAVNDVVYNLGVSGSYTAIMYTATSGNRAFKFGYVLTSNYTQMKGSTSSTGLLFPLKGTITTTTVSSSTNGFLCDYYTGGSQPVYAPADGTAVFKQANNNGTLTSYGNWIEFTSADYNIKLAHLNSFNGVTLQIPSTKTAQKSADSATTHIILATKTVKRGDLLGHSGTTGNSSGHHLHLEVKKNGTPVNPKTTFTEW